VTDEALTQCIKTLRRQLGDQASMPRFIETVPKHGYRFIAPVVTSDGPRAEVVMAKSPAASGTASRGPRFLRLGAAGTAGGGAAGLSGGLLYGFATASGPSSSGVGEASALLVLISLTMLAGLIGGAGVSFGLAAAAVAKRRGLAWTVAGGAGGGLVVGAFARLLGLDAFNLLLGQSPADITGGLEGAVLGGAAGLGAWFATRAGRFRSVQLSLPPALVSGGCAGIIVPLLGGQMMGGSLDLLARQFPASRLRLDQIGAMFGESGFGPVSRMVTGAIEGALFAVGIVGAIMLAQRRSSGEDAPGQ
jgi:hypothetical protein